MSKKNTTTRRKGFSLLSLLLGIILGIIICVGLLGGGIYMLVTGDLESILDVGLGFFGKSNKDDDGNYVYINTDEESGGFASLASVVSWIAGVDDFMTFSVNDLSEKIPAVALFADSLVDMVSDYIDLDTEEVYAQPFNEFTDYILDKVEDIKLASLLDKLGASDDLTDNILVSAMIYGMDAKYVTAEDGTEYPVWYNEFTAETDENGETTSYVCTETGATLDDAYVQYLVASGDNFRLYFYGYPTDETNEDGTAADTTYNIAVQTGTGTYAAPDEAVEYTCASATLSGNYYTDADGKVDVNPITIRTLMEDPFANLYEVYISDLFKDDTGMVDEILGDVSIGELMNNDVDFGEIIYSIQLGTLMPVTVSAETSSAQSIMMYLVYGVDGLTAATDADAAYDYTGTYHTIPEDGSGTSENLPCYIVLDEEGSVSGVYLDEECIVAAGGTTITQVEDRMNGLMDDLTIGEIIGTSNVNNPIIDMIAGSTINGFADDLNYLTVNQLFCNDIYGTEQVNADGETEQLATLYEVVATEEDIDENSDTPQIAFNSSYIYFTEGGSGIYQLAGYNGHLESYEAAEGETIYTYGEVNSLWKLMLYKGGVEQAYMISSINAMFYNITDNIQNSTMNTLVEAGILSNVSSTLLEAHLAYYNSTTTSFTPSEKTVGDMTFIELINFLGNYTYIQIGSGN